MRELRAIITGNSLIMRHREFGAFENRVCFREITVYTRGSTRGAVIPPA